MGQLSEPILTYWQPILLWRGLDNNNLIAPGAVVVNRHNRVTNAIFGKQSFYRLNQRGGIGTT